WIDGGGYFRARALHEVGSGVAGEEPHRPSPVRTETSSLAPRRGSGRFRNVIRHDVYLRPTARPSPAPDAAHGQTSRLISATTGRRRALSSCQRSYTRPERRSAAIATSSPSARAAAKPPPRILLALGFSRSRGIWAGFTTTKRYLKA